MGNKESTLPGLNVDRNSLFNSSYHMYNRPVVITIEVQDKKSCMCPVVKKLQERLKLLYYLIMLTPRILHTVGNQWQHKIQSNSITMSP